MSITPEVSSPKQSQSSYNKSVFTLVAGLMILNIALMFVATFTPLSLVNQYVFAIPFVGVLVYGVLLFVGEQVAERGLKNRNSTQTVAGTGLLQLTFAMFAAGSLRLLPPELQIQALLATSVITFVFAMVLSVYVFSREKSFQKWSVYSMGCFVGGFVLAIGASFIDVAILVAFGLFFLGFIFKLGWEIWHVREQHHESPKLAAIGTYVAVAGVFVHILQLVVRAMLRRN